MAVTSSRTLTKTFARSELLKWQILTALRRTVSLREETRIRLNQALDRQWVKAVHIYGITDEGECSGKLILQVDWDEYKLHIYRGKGVITIDGSWTNRTALEVDEAVSIFTEWVEQHRLTTRYAIESVTPEDGTELSRFLGFLPTEEPKWSGDAHGTTLSNRDLSELSIGCFFAD